MLDHNRCHELDKAGISVHLSVNLLDAHQSTKY